MVSILDLMENAGPTIQAELLQAAAREEIDLLFEVPRGQQLVLLPNQHYFDFKESFFGVPAPEKTPEYLVLLPELCDQLLRAKHVDLRDAKCAYRKVFDVLAKEASHLLRSLPADAGNNPISPVQIESFGTKPSELPPGMCWESWAFKPHHTTVWHRVHIEDLFVITSDFVRWMGWEGNPEASHEFVLGRSASKSDEDIDDDFKSPQLLRMCEAAMRFWGNSRVLSDDPSTHPSNQTVIDWLMASGASFTKTSAENAAALIKPNFALRAGAPVKTK